MASAVMDSGSSPPPQACQACEVERASRIPSRGGGLWNPCCSCLFSPLPDDMMANVMFSFLAPSELASAAEVCRRWKFIGTQESLWRTVDTREAGIRSVKQLAEFARWRGRGVRTLRVGRELVLLPEDLARLGRDMPRLHSLSLAGQEATTAQSIAGLVAAQGHLRELDLSGTNGVSDGVLRALAARSTLRRLSIAQCPDVTAAGVEQLVASPAGERLVAVDISGLPQVGHAVAAALVARMPHLKELYCARLGPWTRASLASVFSAPRRAAPYKRPVPLRAIDVSAADALATGSGLTSDALLAAARTSRFRGLRVLRAAGSRDVDGAAWSAVLAAVRHIVDVDLRDCPGVDDAVLAVLGNHHAATLRRVDVEGCDGVTEDGVARLLGRVHASCAVLWRRAAGPGGAAWPLLP